MSNKGICTSPNGPENCKSPTCPGRFRADHLAQKGTVSEILKAVESDRVNTGEKEVAPFEAATPIRYSFVKEFAEQEAAFKQDFDGFPNRFFNADLRGSKTRLGDEDDGRGSWVYVDARWTSNHLAKATSAPSDYKVSTDEVAGICGELGLHDFQEVTDPSILRAIKANDRIWLARNNKEEQILISDNTVRTRAFNVFSFTRTDKPPIDRSFMMTDTRVMAGLTRIKRKTGDEEFIDNTLSHKPNYTEYKEVAAATILDLEKAQYEGANFIAQRKYVKEHSGKVATAWMDKKNPDEEHKNLMHSTSLLKTFKKVEIDNDVDPAEFADFEHAIHKVKAKLPSIPGGKEPELRIRKLGKHKATGVFFPHKNTICVDVKTSSSFIHEYGHYCDLVVKNNASLSSEFRDISQAYTHNLKVPAEIASKRDYYSTPTEIFARGFEMYANQKLGINNRLLNPEKFNGFDFEPFKKDPELKTRMFSLFDKIFAK